MAEKTTCAVLGCVVRPKGSESACAAHRATYAMQQEIMKRQQLEQELDQVLDILLNFPERAEQLELVEVGFPEQFKLWEGLNTKQGSPEEEEPPAAEPASDREPQTKSQPTKNSDCGVGFQQPPAPLSLKRGDQTHRPAQEGRRVLRKLPAPPPPKPKMKGRESCVLKH